MPDKDELLRVNPSEGDRLRDSSGAATERVWVDQSAAGRHESANPLPCALESLAIRGWSDLHDPAGVGRRDLEDLAEHKGDPLASFQALKHRAADLAVTSLRRCSICGMSSRASSAAAVLRAASLSIQLEFDMKLRITPTLSFPARRAIPNSAAQRVSSLFFSRFVQKL